MTITIRRESTLLYEYKLLLTKERALSKWNALFYLLCLWHWLKQIDLGCHLQRTLRHQIWSRDFRFDQRSKCVNSPFFVLISTGKNTSIVTGFMCYFYVWDSIFEKGLGFHWERVAKILRPATSRWRLFPSVNIQTNRFNQMQNRRHCVIFYPFYQDLLPDTCTYRCELPERLVLDQKIHFI